MDQSKFQLSRNAPRAASRVMAVLAAFGAAATVAFAQTSGCFTTLYLDGACDAGYSCVPKEECGQVTIFLNEPIRTTATPGERVTTGDFDATCRLDYFLPDENGVCNVSANCQFAANGTQASGLFCQQDPGDH